MSQIKVTYRNILENSSVQVTTSTGGDVDSTSYPLYRAYDRDIGKVFIGVATTTQDVQIIVNQGASADNTYYAANRLIIPLGHNLDGSVVLLQYSSDGFSADINSATSWTQSGSGMIDKSFTSNTQRYWRLYIYTPSTPPSLSEMFLGQDYSFQRNPGLGSRVGKQTNIYRDETRSGKRRAVKFGELRNRLNYEIAIVESTQKEDFETWISHTEGEKPFYLTDESGSVLFVEMMNDLEFTHKGRSLYSNSLDLLEVL